MGTDRIGRVTPDGDIESVDLPATATMPSMIIFGPSGTLWVSLNRANALARISHDARVTTHPLPTPGAGPVGLAAGQDAVWFTDITAGRIGRIDDTRRVRELPLRDSACRPHAIVAAPDGGFWFTEWATSRVGHITPRGDVCHVALSPASEPHGLCIGPDGRSGSRWRPAASHASTSKPERDRSSRCVGAICPTAPTGQVL
jgi:virginiamycin B lyase